MLCVIWLLSKEIMELTSGETLAGYPSEIVIVKEWKSHISPWLKKLIGSILPENPQQALGLFGTELVDDLLSQQDSPQKVFDIYGVGQILHLIGDSKRAKDLFVELSKTVPYASIDVDIAAACAVQQLTSERHHYLQRAFEKQPENPCLWNVLGTSYLGMNCKDKGLELLGRSIEKIPTHKFSFSNYLFYSHYAEELDCQKIFEDHKRYAKFNANVEVITDYKNSPDPNRPLRIGFISPDFSRHPVGTLIEPFISLSDKDNFELFAFSNVSKEDGQTKKLRGLFDHFRRVSGLASRKVVEMILEDQIDILVDLAGHTGNNRLDVMAYKAAPIQVTYLGYFDTTGLEQVDYFLTDSLMSPPETQKYHTEELFCLPSTCLSYNAAIDTPNITPSPCLKNGYITYGMYSSPTKITKKMARLWGRILNNTKDSRLKMVLKDGDSEETVSNVLSILEKCDVPCERVEIQGKIPLEEYFAAYADVDIMLDTFPYNGGMTTCDALWMGVPVVSLVGEHHFSRVGLSLLSAVGLEYFAAEAEEEFVAKASALSAMPDSLAKIRHTLRQRVLASPLGDPKLQTNNIENAYREMWRRWCEKKCD